MISTAFRDVSRSFTVIGVGLLLYGWAAGCTPYLGTTSASFLRHAKTNPDPNLRYLAYAKLGSPNLYDDDREKTAAVDFLIKRYLEGREPIAIRAMIIRSLGNLRDPRARELALKAASDSDAVLRIEGCRALGKVGREGDATTLVRVMSTDSLEDCRIAAIEALGSLKPKDTRILTRIVDGMENDDPAIRLESVTSLRAITGVDHGVVADEWRKALHLPRGDEPPVAQAPPPPEPAVKPGPFAAIAKAAAKLRESAPVFTSSAATDLKPLLATPKAPLAQ